MMASIPNMRSAPLPVPAAKTAAAGDPASGGFAVQLPAPQVPGQPAATPPAQPAIAAELLESIAPQIIAPEGGDDGSDGDGTAPAKTEKTTTDEGQPDAAILVPFVQNLPNVPAPQAQPAQGAAPAAPAAQATEAAALPCGMIGNGKNGALAPDGVDAPSEESDAPDLKTATEAVVKALLQRKAPSTKQVAAKPAANDKPEPAPAKDAAKTPSAPTPAATAATAILQNAAPLVTPETAQPNLSPAASPAPAAAGRSAAIEGMRATDLAATERKLDLARDSAWLDRLAHDIARSASDDAPLRFRLHPQTLGSLHVELQQGDRGAAVRMTVDTEAARQILTDAQPRLAAEARAQGVRIAETHVDLFGSGRHAPGDQRRQDEARQTPFIRTATGADREANAARASGRGRLDRYA